MKQPPDPSQPASSRRGFLQATAAGALIGGALGDGPLRLTYGPRRTAPATPGPDEPIRMAIIGTGGMGGGHLHSIIGLNAAGREQVQIVALADVCKPRLDGALQAASEKQPGVEVKAYRDYHEVLAREDIHAVLIASPEHWHAQHGVDAVRAGKDVYCEKPMTLRLHEALALREVVKDSDRVFCVGTQHMMLPKYQEARRLIQSGALGQLVWSQTSYCRNSKGGEWNYYGIDPQVKPGEMLDWKAWCGPQPVVPFDTKVYHRWRRYKDWSTGIIGDLLVHQLSPLVWAIGLGWPHRVTAAGDHFVDMDMENHDQVLMTVEFQDPIKHQVFVAGSAANEIGIDIMVRGHKARLELGGSACVLRPERIWADDVDPQEIRTVQVNDQDEMRLQWLKAIRTRSKPLGDVDMAAKVMVAVDLATRSMWDGRAYYFDPERMRAISA
ncbi:MAG TPA: Gfo/Idh/MocA family oxidoreductase [Planctomycetota bacterium]